MAALADCLILSDQKGPASGFLKFPHINCMSKMATGRQEKDVATTVEKSEETSHETGMMSFSRIVLFVLVLTSLSI